MKLLSLTEAANMSKTAGIGVRWLRDLALLAVVTTTLLFFLLRLAGDPALVLAGPDASE